MKHWQQLTKAERRDIISIVSRQRVLPQIAIEKDWWVTVTLKALSMTKYSSLMSFKRGTNRNEENNTLFRGCSKGR